MLTRWEPFVSSGRRGDFVDESTRIQQAADCDESETVQPPSKTGLLKRIFRRIKRIRIKKISPEEKTS